MALRTRTHGLVVTEHTFDVPLDHTSPDGEQISVFAREVADPDGLDRPFLVYLQGGPGQEAPRPTRGPSSPAWLERALQDYRVLMLDQRGTGRSTPVGTLAGMTPQEQAGYLTHFRADAIVADAEHIRRLLGVERWSVLGQSFGGFTTLAYLSSAPDGLREAFFTGGLPPIGRHPDEIYAATFTRALERNRRYFERYPGDLARVRDLQAYLDGNDVRLPNGDPFTSRRLRQIGSVLGASDGFEHLHYLLERPIDSPALRHDALTMGPFSGRNPLYVVIHESSYADGHATRWSADRVRPAEFAERPELFTGEHVFPWMLEDYAELAPLREAANLLAEHEWPRLYDAEVLARNEVPCSAAIYAEDLYVEHAFSVETAAAVRGLRGWVTDEYEHNGLRADGGRILDRLIALARGRV